MQTAEKQTGLTQWSQANPWRPLLVFYSGWIAGAILLFLPQGLPWAGLNSFSSAAMGRSTNWDGESFSMLGPIMHFLMAVLYAFPIIAVSRYWRVWRGVLIGSLAGGVCYLVNWLVVHFTLPAYEGNEPRVLVTHLAYGLYVTAIYKAWVAERVKGIVQRPG